MAPPPFDPKGISIWQDRVAKAARRAMRMVRMVRMGYWNLSLRTYRTEVVLKCLNVTPKSKTANFVSSEMLPYISIEKFPAVSGVLILYPTEQIISVTV